MLIRILICCSVQYLPQTWNKVYCDFKAVCRAFQVLGWGFVLFCFLNSYLFISLAVPGLSSGTRSSIFVAAGGEWDLVPRPESEPRAPAFGVQSLSQWTTREVPGLGFISKSLLESLSDLGNHMICISLSIGDIKAGCPCHTSLDCCGGYELMSLKWVAVMSHAGMRCPRGLMVKGMSPLPVALVWSSQLWSKASSVWSTVHNSILLSIDRRPFGLHDWPDPVLIELSSYTVRNKKFDSIMSSFEKWAEIFPGTYFPAFWKSF